MKYILLFLVSLGFAQSRKVIKHSFIYCGDEAKTMKYLYFNAFTHPNLCPEKMVAYPVTRPSCHESQEIINRCKNVTECEADFTCVKAQEGMSRRELIERVRTNQALPLFHTLNPLTPLERENPPPK